MGETIFTFSYPENSGFGSSEIHFHSGSPDLGGLFSAESDHPRLFVSDTTIASLPSMKDFIGSFVPEKNDSENLDTRIRGNDILLILGPGEKFKTLESVTQIDVAALAHNFNRNCEFVGIGGGVICDMTAFAASIYKRGVDVSFVPTTLLAMVDASVRMRHQGIQKHDWLFLARKKTARLVGFCPVPSRERIHFGAWRGFKNGTSFFAGNVEDTRGKQ